MMYHAAEIMDRAEKFTRLRRGYERLEGNVDRSWQMAIVCKRFSDRLYARGHSVIEYEYGA
jgi:hypothetical protein